MFIKEYPEFGDVKLVKNTAPVTSADKQYFYMKISIDGKKHHFLLTDTEMSRGINRAHKNIDDILNQVPIKTKISACVWISIYASLMTALAMGMMIKYMG